MTYSRVCDRDHDDMISMMLADDNMTAASTNADSNTRRFVPSRSAEGSKWHFCAIIPRGREQRLTAALLWDCYIGSSVQCTRTTLTLQSDDHFDSAKETI